MNTEPPSHPEQAADDLADIAARIDQLLSDAEAQALEEHERNTLLRLVRDSLAVLTDRIDRLATDTAEAEARSRGLLEGLQENVERERLFLAARLDRLEGTLSRLPDPAEHSSSLQQLAETLSRLDSLEGAVTESLSESRVNVSQSLASLGALLDAERRNTERLWTSTVAELVERFRHLAGRLDALETAVGQIMAEVALEGTGFLPGAVRELATELRKIRSSVAARTRSAGRDAAPQSIRGADGQEKRSIKSTRTESRQPPARQRRGPAKKVSDVNEASDARVQRDLPARSRRPRPSTTPQTG